MRGVILFLGAVGLLIWSLLAWAAAGLLGFAEGIAASSTGFIPLPPELVLWVAALMGGAGGFLVWTVWFIGAALIALVTMALLALAPRGHRRAAHADRDYTYEAVQPGVYEHPRTGKPGPAPVRPGGSADSRSAEEIVSRVLGKSTRR